MVDEVRNVLRGDFTHYLMMTSSRIEYTDHSPVCKDIVFHDWGYPTKRNHNVSMDKVNRCIDGDYMHKDLVNALLGTKKTDYIEKVCKWVTGKKPYRRRSNKPDNNREWAVILGITPSIDMFSIRDDTLPQSARGWMVTEIK